MDHLGFFGNQKIPTEPTSARAFERKLFWSLDKTCAPGRLLSTTHWDGDKPQGNEEICGETWSRAQQIHEQPSDLNLRLKRSSYVDANEGAEKIPP